MMEDLETHLKSRHMTPMHQYWIDDGNDLVVFPLWNLSGQMVGYQNYRRTGVKGSGRNNPHDGKYFSRFTKDVICMWGIESWNMSNALFVNEGLFDAARFTANGCSSVSLFANGLSRPLKSWVAFVMQFRPVVFVQDGDSAGSHLKHPGCFVEKCPDGDDAASASQEWLDELKHKYEGV